MKNELKLISAGELLNQPLATDLELAAEMAEDAARILRCHGEERAGSATWRLADALALLSKYGDDLPGIHEPTGLGAKVDCARISTPKTGVRAQCRHAPSKTGTPDT